MFCLHQALQVRKILSYQLTEGLRHFVYNKHTDTYHIQDRGLKCT
jgi:hypothetical protein